MCEVIYLNHPTQESISRSIAYISCEDMNMAFLFYIFWKRLVKGTILSNFYQWFNMEMPPGIDVHVSGLS